MKKERIGLFGGTFNPIHSGHLKAADIVQRKFILDKILFIPSYIPPHKDSVEVASPFHRLKMVELALQSYSNFVPSSIEIDAGGKSYSIIMLNKVKKLYPKALIFFILGVDSFLEIDTWKDYKKVLKQCFFVVTDRPGFHLDRAKEILRGKYKKRIYELSRSETVMDDMLLSFNVFLLSLDALDVSSTEIRKRIKRNDPIKETVPEGVEAYIKENRLYKV